MKKILALVFICIFTLTCLVACGGGKGGWKKPCVPQKWQNSPLLF
jgi:hypothetical protein